MDCWLRAKSDSSFRPASVKYFEKCSQLRLLAGKSSWEDITEGVIQKHRGKKGSERAAVRDALTISRLSMPTLRKLAATELMSFSLIHDLNSLTAKAAETPGGETKAPCQAKIKNMPRQKANVFGAVPLHLP